MSNKRRVDDEGPQDDLKKQKIEGEGNDDFCFDRVHQAVIESVAKSLPESLSALPPPAKGCQLNLKQFNYLVTLLYPDDDITYLIPKYTVCASDDWLLHVAQTGTPDLKLVSDLLYLVFFEGNDDNPVDSVTPAEWKRYHEMTTGKYKEYKINPYDLKAPLLNVGKVFYIDMEGIA